MNQDSLMKVMQSPQLFPTELSIWVDAHGLLHGKVYGNGILFFHSHKKQFINELIEELDDEASVFLERRYRVGE